MYAFVSHESACEVLRLLSREAHAAEGLPRWPETARRLPWDGSCVSGQRDLASTRAEKSLRELGMTARPVDLMVPTRRTRSSGKTARFHVWSSVLPAGSLLAAGPDLMVSGPELAVIQLCSAQGKLDALLDSHVRAVRAEADVLAQLGVDDDPVIDHPLEWERIRRLVGAVVVACEFAGTYRLGSGQRPTSFHASPLMGVDSLWHTIDEVGEASGTRRARRVCDMMVEGSASPMETSLALMLSLPVEFGGFGLERPQLNRALDVSGLRGVAADRDVVTPDFLWPAQRVALEYDSAEFHSGGGRRGRTDAVRANILAALGYRVLRATPETVLALPDLTLLAGQVACALGKRPEPTTSTEDLRRRKLFMLLMPRSRREA